MNPLSPPKASWCQPIYRVCSGAAHGVSKIAQVWSDTPKTFKIPLEAAAILNMNGEWLGPKGALAAAITLLEIPSHLAGFLRNQPISLFGKRWQLLPSSCSEDPKAPLADLDQKIGVFERAQVHGATPPLISPRNTIPMRSNSVTPAPFSHDCVKRTDHNLEVLIQNISHFSILKALLTYSGITNTDSASLLTLVAKLSHPTNKNSSPWKVFMNHYQKQMSWWGTLKTGFIYLFLWKWIPIIPNTVDAYLKNMLRELRINLKENDQKRTEFFDKFIKEIDNFLDVYNGAAETYVKDDERKGNLDYYRKNAIERMLPRDKSEEGKTPAELRTSIYKKLSTSIVDHFSPKVRFGFFLENWLNNQIKKTLRDVILPEVFLALHDEGTEATKQQNIPFFLGLTKTLTEQISKIQVSGKKTTLSGIENFKPLVQKFLRAIELAKCNTPEALRKKMQELEKPRKGLDEVVCNSILTGLQNALAVASDYFLQQKNTEELFSNIFQSLEAPFLGNLPKTPHDLAEMMVEYKGAKILFKQAVSTLSKQIVQEAIADKVRGGTVPETMEKIAQNIFSQHKVRCLTTFEQLKIMSDTILAKVNHCQEFFADHTGIHPDLEAYVSLIKGFQHKERVSITLDQDPPPEIALLSPAEQDSILHVMFPMYKEANHLMDCILSLQNLQTRHIFQADRLGILRQLKKTIEQLNLAHPAQARLKLLHLLQDPLAQLEALDPEITKVVANHLQEIKKPLTSLIAQQNALDAFAKIQPFPKSDIEHLGLIDHLLLFIQGKPSPNFQKSHCIEEIKQNLKIAIPTLKDQYRAFELLDQISKYPNLSMPRPDFNETIWKPLSIILNEHKTQIEKNKQKTILLLKKQISDAHGFCSAKEADADTSRKSTWKELQNNALSLQSSAEHLTKLARKAQKEQHLHASASQLGQTLGILGFIFGLATGKTAPEIGAAMGALSFSSIANLGDLVKGKWLKFSLSMIGTTAASILAAKTFKESNLAQTLPEPIKDWAPALVSGTLAAAGLEYAGSKLTEKTIEVGAAVAIPPITGIVETAYDDFIMNPIVINALGKIMVNQMLDLFPPKK